LRRLQVLTAVRVFVGFFLSMVLSFRADKKRR
jgi:hypothetical protein